MKKNIMFLLSILLVSIFTLAACGGTSGFAHNPALTDNVIGNGSIAVQKGDYLYYVNGIYNMEGYTAGDNSWGKVTYGALYRTKLVNNNVVHDEDGFVKNTELVASKIVGHPNASFYVYGNYIYYSTPNNDKNRTGQSLPEITDFYRVNINGTGNTLLHTSAATELKASDWSVYVNGSEHFVLIKDGSNLISIAQNKQKTTIATSVTGVAFEKSDRFYNNNQAITQGLNDSIYYTREIVEADDLANKTGNILAKTSIGKAQEQVIAQEDGKTFALLSFKNGSLYYQKGESPYNHLYRRTLTNGNLGSEVQLTNSTYKNFYFLNTGTQGGNQVLAQTQTDTLVVLNMVNGQAKPKVVVNTAVTVIAVRDTFVVYLNNEAKTLHTIDVWAANPESTIKTVATGEKAFKTDSKTFAYFDGHSLYIYASYKPENAEETEKFYLNRITGFNGETKIEFVGKFKDSHLPEKPDNSDALPGEEQIWIK